MNPEVVETSQGLALAYYQEGHPLATQEEAETWAAGHWRTFVPLAVEMLKIRQAFELLRN